MTGDGSVVVENRKGGSRHLRKVDLSQVQRFASLVRELRYFDFKDRYEVGHVTDLEWATMDVKFGDEAKRINHYLGDMYAPRGLWQLEIEIDRISNSIEWTGCNLIAQLSKEFDSKWQIGKPAAQTAATAAAEKHGG